MMRREIWWQRLRCWLSGSSCAGRLQPRDYPLYVTCPVCHEPEVEVWHCDEETRCHACGALIDCPEETTGHAE